MTKVKARDQIVQTFGISADQSQGTALDSSVERSLIGEAGDDSS
jgi:hypothetical protein